MVELQPRRGEDSGSLLGGHCVQDADGPRAALARYLRSAGDCRLARNVGVQCAARYADLRLTSDASRIQKVLATVVVVAHYLSEAEHVAPFQEEGSLLGKRRLERREVHYRGIHFHLPEVRIHRGAQGEPARKSILYVAANGGLVPQRAVERVGRVARCARERGAHVRRDLQPLRHANAVEAHQVPEPRNERTVLWTPRCPGIALVPASDIALHLQSPHATLC